MWWQASKRRLLGRLLGGKHRPEVLMDPEAAGSEEQLHTFRPRSECLGSIHIWKVGRSFTVKSDVNS